MRYFFCLILLLCTLSSHAQVGDPRSDWAIGFSGGWTLSRVNFNPTVRQTFHQAPTAGFTLRYTSEKYFSLLAAVQMEVNYACLGWMEEPYSYRGKPLPDYYRRDIHYLQIPLLTSLALGREKRGARGFLLLGPQIGYALQATKHRGEVWSERRVGEHSVPDRANDIYLQYGKPLEHKIDYGITAGLGIELGTSIGRFLLDARYYYGLSDLFGNAKKDPFSRSAHATIQTKITYLIDLKR